MPGSNRIKGAALGLTVGGIDYWADALSVVFDNEEADSSAVTFADAAAGGARQHFVTISAIQSGQTGSLWRYAWANTGTTVAYKYAPHGNVTPTSDQPHLTGTLVIGPKPALGGEAGAKNEFTFEVRWDINGEPVLDAGASNAATIATILPAGQAVGKVVTLSGVRFTGATAVNFAAVPSASFAVLNDSQIVALIPAGTGAKSVTVVTPSGTSAGVSYTVV